jgi:hypothetical protein
VNAGRSKVNADYAAVKEQTGIAMNSSDVVVAKASRFDGAYFTTATPEDNQTVFKEGVTTTDIQNHMNYKGDAINVGLGAGINPETQKVSPPGISGIGYGKDGDSQTSTTYGAVTGMAGKSDVTTANVSSLNKPLENSFDKTAVEAQLGAQVQVSQAFDTERRTYRLEMAQKEQELRDKAKEAEKRGDMTTHDDLIAKADRQQHDMVLFDSITGAIYGPNTNGVTGYVARAVAPEVSFRIGQYFKSTNGEGSAPHILAHGILAAAVSVATGNDPTTGALSAMGSEAAAPIVAKFLFGDKPISELTAEQKATVSSITSLAGLGLGSTTGDVTSAVNAQQVGQTAVDDNYLTAQEVKSKEAWLSTLAQCNGEKTYICDMARQNVLQLIAKDANTDLMLSVCESNPTSPYCRTERAKADASLKTYRTSDNKTLIRDLDVAQKKEYAESNGYFNRLPTGEIKGWNPSKDRWDAYLQTTEGRLAQSTFTGLQLASGDYAFGVAASALSKSLSGFKVGATGAANETALANSIYKNVSGLSTTEARALDNYLVNSSKATTFSKPSLEQQLAAIAQHGQNSAYITSVTGYKIGSVESVNKAALLETNKILSSGLSKNKLKSQSAVAVAGDPTLGIQTKAYTNTDISLPTVQQLEANGSLKVTQIKGESFFVILNKDRYMDTLRKGYMQSQNPLTPIMENNIYKYINSKTYFASAAYLPGAHAEVQAQNALYRMSSKVNPNNVQVATYKLGTSSKSGAQGGKFTACSHCSGITPPGTNITTGRK